MKYLLNTIYNILIYFWPVLGTIKVERLVNSPGNEMWRWGGGFHGYKRYWRLDWGNKGWRWTRDFDWCQDYFNNIYPHCSEDHQRELDRYMEVLMAESVENPDDHPTVTVVRGGGMIVRERVDLFPKLWAKGREFHRIVYIK